MNFSLALLSSSVPLLPRKTYSTLSKNATRDLELTAVAAIALAVSGLMRYPAPDPKGGGGGGGGKGRGRLPREREFESLFSEPGDAGRKKGSF